MKFKPPINENYCATIVEIKNIIELNNCDNIQSTTIFGYPVIIGKTINVGDTGVFFPPETQLSSKYMKENNLYRHSDLNKDQTQKGYIEDNRRIKTMKMRGNKSCGLFMPLESLSFCLNIKDFDIADSFDEVKGTSICNKYIIKKKSPNSGLNQQRQRIKQSKLIENQFRFHQDTSQLGKNINVFNEKDLISISYKVHGTSVVMSNLICKKKINFFYKLLKMLGIKIMDTKYDYIYSSRKVIKNEDMNTLNDPLHFYNLDIWGIVNERFKEFLDDGMTIYAEIVGYLPTNAPIQEGYDYGCAIGECETYIYRITYTNVSGKVFEFSFKQVQDWCKDRGLNAVPQLYYGLTQDILKEDDTNTFSKYYDKSLTFHDNLLKVLTDKYLEKNCWMCKNKVPAEGIVVRREINDFDAYKLKSFKFFERETRMLNKGTEDIEEQS